MQVLILGSSGQDGHYLARLLTESGHSVLGVSRTTTPVSCDVGDPREVEALVARVRPDRIYLLAAHSSAREGLLEEHQRTIVDGCRHVLSAVERHLPRTRVFVAGSALQFENLGAPIGEDTAFRASSSYALARIQAAWIARHFRARGLCVRIGYLFHHESPLRPVTHIAQRVATAARRIAAGSGGKLTLGAPHVEREWTFAGDVARAMVTVLEQDRENEVVIGSGNAHALATWAEHCFAALGLEWREHCEVETGFVPEYERLVSDPRRLHSLGWRPKVSMQELARSMVECVEMPVFA